MGDWWTLGSMGSFFTKEYNIERGQRYETTISLPLHRPR